MTNYRGTRPEDMIRLRLEKADQGNRGGRDRLIALIEQYIRAQAVAHGGKVQRVPCPSGERWSELASGKAPKLPTESQLTLYANNAMRALAEGKAGPMRRVYFSVAMHRILHPS